MYFEYGNNGYNIFLEVINFKIYLLFIEKYDNQQSELIGVFSTEDKANKYKNKYYFNSRGYVEEYLIDEKEK